MKSKPKRKPSRLRKKVVWRWYDIVMDSLFSDEFATERGCRSAFSEIYYKFYGYPVRVTLSWRERK